MRHRLVARLMDRPRVIIGRSSTLDMPVVKLNPEYKNQNWLRYRWKLALFSLVALVFVGCTDTQLSRNTTLAANGIASFYRDEALANRTQFINDPGSIPSFADISSGSIQTGGSATASITIPYGNQVTESASALISTVQIPSKNHNAESNRLLTAKLHHNTGHRFKHTWANARSFDLCYDASQDRGRSGRARSKGWLDRRSDHGAVR